MRLHAGKSRSPFGDLRSLIHEAIKDCWGGSHPDETYDQELEADPALKKKSVYVPDDIKHSIKKWSRSMGLSHAKRRKQAN